MNHTTYIWTLGASRVKTAFIRSFVVLVTQAVFLCSKEKGFQSPQCFFLQKNSVFSGTASFRQGWEEAQAKLERNVYRGKGRSPEKKMPSLGFCPNYLPKCQIRLEQFLSGVRWDSHRPSEANVQHGETRWDVQRSVSFEGSSSRLSKITWW